jgi:hypothetical protein
VANLELALDCFALDFDQAAKIIVWALMRLFVLLSKISCVKRFHLQGVAGPNDSK